MSVKIRMTRTGRRKAAYFRVVVADSRRARDGRVVEQIGRYQPLQPNDNLLIDEARALYWLQNGATPSDTVRSLLKRLGILRKYHEMRYGPSVPVGTEGHHQPAAAKPAPAPAPAPVSEPAPAVVSEPAVAEVAAPEAPAESAPSQE